jgi:hypothetical protein
MLVDEIPDQYEAVVTSRGKDATSVWRPFDAVQGGGVALELEKGLSRLPHVKNTNDIGVLRECGQEVGIVRRGCCKVSEPLPIRAGEGQVYPYRQFSTMAEARGPTVMDRTGWSYQGSSLL